MYLVKTANENTAQLRPNAIDTLATVVRNIGEKTLMSKEMERLIECALTSLNEADTDRPEMRTHIYSLLVASAEIMTDDMEAFLPRIVNHMLYSVTTELMENDNVLSASNTEQLNRAYVAEKEEAIVSLKLLAEFTGTAFTPYF